MTQKRAKPAPKKTERRSGRSETRVHHPPKRRQAAKTKPPVRVSGLAMTKPVRSKELADERAKGQNPPRRTASRKRTARSRQRG